LIDWKSLFQLQSQTGRINLQGSQMLEGENCFECWWGGRRLL